MSWKRNWSDTIYGNGGSDSLIGGIGSDVYYVDTKDDRITENKNESWGHRYYLLYGQVCFGYGKAQDISKNYISEAQQSLQQAAKAPTTSKEIPRTVIERAPKQ